MHARIAAFAFAAATAAGVVIGAPRHALADGSPVVTLGVTLVGPMRLPFYTTTATPVTSARVIGYGPSPDFAPIYDTSVRRPVTTRPVGNVQTNGENVDIDYDDEAAARASHAPPDFSGRHNPALANFEALPSSLR